MYEQEKILLFILHIYSKLNNIIYNIYIKNDIIKKIHTKEHMIMKYQSCDKQEKIDYYIETKKVGIIGIVGNIGLLIIKIIIAMYSKSQAIFADSINSATDVFSSIMTLIGGKISNEPSDEGHNYGHGKAEYIFSLIISIITILLSIKIFSNGIDSLINSSEFIFSTSLVVICIVTILTKFTMFLYTNKIYKKTENILIKANSQDHLNDVFTTLSVLVGVVAGAFKIYWLDGIIALIIAIRIFCVAIKILLDSYDVLMDKSISEEKMKKIVECIKGYSEIDHIDKITSKTVGKKFLIIIKVSVDGNMTVKESHIIAGKMKAKILKIEDIYDVIVHINPK